MGLCHCARMMKGCEFEDQFYFHRSMIFQVEGLLRFVLNIRSKGWGSASPHTLYFASWKILLAAKVRVDALCLYISFFGSCMMGSRS